MRTVAEPIVGSEVTVEPATDGITINGIPADLDHVRKADVRVDLATDRQRAFITEHVLGVLGLHGIEAAAVTGRVSEWSFDRPEHRFCYAAGLPPSSVVGHPAGLPNPDLSTALADATTVGTADETRTTVSEPVTVTTEQGSITAEPREYGKGIRFDVTYKDAEITAEIDPKAANDPGLIEDITSATTPYLSPDTTTAVTHSLADLLSDTAVIGGFDDLRVTVDLDDSYHTLTIGLPRAAHERGVIDRRE